MTTVSVASHRVREGCELYIEHRDLEIKNIREAAIFAMTQKRRLFRKNLTGEQAMKEYKESGYWEEASELYYFQHQRVKLLLKVADVAIANTNQYLELTEQNIKDIGAYLC